MDFDLLLMYVQLFMMSYICDIGLELENYNTELRYLCIFAWKSSHLFDVIRSSNSPFVKHLPRYIYPIVIESLVL